MSRFDAPPTWKLLLVLIDWWGEGPAEANFGAGLLSESSGTVWPGTSCVVDVDGERSFNLTFCCYGVMYNKFEKILRKFRTDSAHVSDTGAVDRIATSLRSTTHDERSVLVLGFD